MMKSHIILIIIIVSLICSCTKNNSYSSLPIEPFFDDGVYFISFKDHSSEDLFSGDWGAPQLEKEKGFFRLLRKGSGQLKVTIPLPEKYILNISVFNDPGDLKVTINGSDLELKNKRCFLKKELLKAGENIISFIADNPVRFSGVAFYPFRALRYPGFKKRYTKGNLLMLPGKLKFFINPLPGEFISLRPQVGKHSNLEFKIKIRSEKGVLSEKNVSVKSEETLKIIPLPGFSQEIELVPLKRRVGFIKLYDSFLITNNLNKSEKEKLSKSVKESAKKKNLLIILLDAARADHFGYHGYKRDTTPNIDKFASVSHIFSNARSQASFTLASTGTLITGLSPEFHGVISKYYSKLGKDKKTLSSLFTEKGYFTGAISGNPNFSKTYGYEKGFNYFKELFLKHPEVTANQFIDPFKDMLDKSDGRHFFIYLHIREPHDPFEMPKPFLGKFQKVFSKRGGSLRKFGRNFHKSYLKKNVNIALLRDIYDENLAFGDMVFGMIIDILKKRGIYSDTVTVFLSDHGEAIGEHGMIGHGHVLYREGIRIPLVVHIPGMEKRIFKGPAITSDLVVTISKLFGLNYPYLESSYGYDLYDLPVNRRFFVRSINTFNYPSYAVVRYPYKLIVNFPVIPNEILLFNIDKDPNEKYPLQGKDLLKKSLLSRLFYHLKMAGQFRGNIAAPKLRDEDIRSLKSLGYIQ